MAAHKDAYACKPVKNYITIISLAITVLIQVGTVFWWASSMTTEIKAVKGEVEEVRKLGTQFSRLEQRVQSTEAWIAEFKPLQLELIRGIERLNGLYSLVLQTNERPNTQIKVVPGGK